MREIHDRAISMYRLEKGPDFRNNAGTIARNGAIHVYVLDLQDAFGSVQTSKLAEILQRPRWLHPSYGWGRNTEVATEILERYFVHSTGGLIQGAPASPVLFEEYANRLIGWGSVFDDPILLGGWSSLNGIHYGRYADDLVFAADRPLSKAAKKRIKKFLTDAGFRINPSKARGFTLRRQTVTVNGVSLRLTSSGIRIFMRRSKLTQLEGMLHLANTGRPVNHAAIHGMMGLFWATTRKGHYNATEKRVLDAYRRFKPVKKERPEFYIDRPYLLGPAL
jgi:hypothetical protein